MFFSPTERLLRLEEKEREDGTAASRKGRSEARTSKQREVTTQSARLILQFTPQIELSIHTKRRREKKERSRVSAEC